MPTPPGVYTYTVDVQITFAAETLEGSIGSTLTQAEDVDLLASATSGILTASPFGGMDDLVVDVKASRRPAGEAFAVLDIVRVSADAKTVEGDRVHFGVEVVGEVRTVHEDGDVLIWTNDPRTPVAAQWVAPEFLTREA